MNNLASKRCLPCEAGIPPIEKDKAKEMITELKNWDLIDNCKSIVKEFKFKNFLRTMSFVNAIAWIANQENHHPDLEVGYNYCRVRYSTHAIEGLSDNDFICAAKVDRLLTQ